MGSETFMWSDRVVMFDGSDRSIDVQSGDSLSAYSKAIYGDFEHIEAFTRHNNEYIANKSLIRTGEKIYHYGQLPGEPMPHAPVKNPTPGTPIPSANPNQLSQLFAWMSATASPYSGWKLVSSAGADASIQVFTGQYFQLGMKEIANPTTVNWYNAAGIGFSGGLELGMGGSFSIAPPGAPGGGGIYKFPNAGSAVDEDEINGSFILFEVAAGLLVGYSFSVFVFGCKGLPEILVNSIYRILNGNMTPMIPLMPAGFIVMHGVTATSPNAGVAVRGGYMTDLFS